MAFLSAGRRPVPRSSKRTNLVFRFESDVPPFFKFCFYGAFLVTTSLVIFLISASCMIIRHLDFQAPANGTYGGFSADVKLTAEAVSVDPISRTIVMNWYPDFTMFSCHLEPPSVVDIFISEYNIILLDTTSPSWSSQPGDQPAFRLNSTESCFGVVSKYASFQTISKLVASKEYLRVESIGRQATFQDYPFDLYLAPFLFYVRDNSTGVVSPLQISSSFGIAVNFKISLLDNAELSYNDVENNLQFFLRIERSPATKAFVVMVGITSWLTAIAFLIICAATIVYRPHEIFSEMFVVPVGAVFAFSSVRANLPGAPEGFGATIDLFTILPVLIVMSLCSFVLLIVILHRRICQIKGGLSSKENPNGMYDFGSLTSSRGDPADPTTIYKDAEKGRASMNPQRCPCMLDVLSSEAPSPPDTSKVMTSVIQRGDLVIGYGSEGFTSPESGWDSQRSQSRNAHDEENVNYLRKSVWQLDEWTEHAS